MFYNFNSISFTLLYRLPSLDKEGKIYLPFSEDKLGSLKIF